MTSDEPLMGREPPPRKATPGLRESVEVGAERAAAESRLKERGWQGLARTEAGLIFGVLTMAIFQVFGTPWVANLENTFKAVGLFLWLFMAILTLSFGVVRHADCLAVLLGEPYGTLILTLSVIGIEAAMMAALMLNGEDNPTLVRAGLTPGYR